MPDGARKRIHSSPRFSARLSFVDLFMKRSMPYVTGLKTCWRTDLSVGANAEQGIVFQMASRKIAIVPENIEIFHFSNFMRSLIFDPVIYLLSNLSGFLDG